jgi:hypothetical protein
MKSSLIGIPFVARCLFAIVGLAVIASCGDPSVDPEEGDDGESPLTESEIDDWFDEQDVVVAPWAHKIDPSVMEGAIIDTDRISFPRDGNEDLLNIKTNNIIYSESLDVPDWNILRRVTETAHTEQQLVFLTRQAMLDELYLKYEPSAEEGQQQQELETPYHVQLSYPFKICKNPEGNFEECNIGSKPTTEAAAEAGGALLITPTINLWINEFETQGSFTAPATAVCRCLAYSMHNGGGTDNWSQLEKIDDHCGDDGRDVDDERLHYNFLEGRVPFELDILEVQARCNSTPDRWQLRMKADGSISLPYEFAFTVAYTKPPTPLGREIPLPLRVVVPTPIGPVTVSGSFELTYEFTIGGSVSVGLMGNEALTAGLKLDFGVELDGNQLQKVGSSSDEAADFYLRAGTPSLAGKAEARVNLDLNGHFKTKIYDAAGPVFTVAPFVEAGVTVGASTTTGPACEIGFKSGIKLKVSAEAGIPLTNFNQRLPPQTIFNSCTLDEGSILRENLCFEDAMVQNFCRSATPPEPDSVRLVAYPPDTPAGRGGDPDGVDIQKIYLMRNGHVLIPNKVIVDGSELSGNLENLLGPSSPAMPCDGISTPDWLSYGVSFTNSLVVSFDSEIEADDKIMIGHQFDQHCSSSGTAAIQIGDAANNKWGPPITSTQWSETTVEARVAQEGCIEPAGSGLWDTPGSDVCIQPQAY